MKKFTCIAFALGLTLIACTDPSDPVPPGDDVDAAPASNTDAPTADLCGGWQWMKQSDFDCSTITPGGTQPAGTCSPELIINSATCTVKCAGMFWGPGGGSTVTADQASGMLEFQNSGGTFRCFQRR